MRFSLVRLSRPTRKHIGGSCYCHLSSRPISGAPHAPLLLASRLFIPSWCVPIPCGRRSSVSTLPFRHSPLALSVWINLHKLQKQRHGVQAIPDLSPTK